MRITSPLVAFMFLGAAAARVVPDIAGRDVAVTDSNGGPSTPTGIVYSHPSGSPTEASAHSIPTSRAVMPTGAHSHYPGTPTGASDHPSPSAESRSHSPASHAGQPTDGHSHSPVSPTATMNGTYSYHPTQLTTAVVPSPRSGAPSWASDHPTPSVSHARSANPSDVRGHKSGLPSGVSIEPSANPS